MASKFLLVPEMEFRRLQKCNETTSNTILEEVERPNERELVKTYQSMEQMLLDPKISNQEKVARHVEDMNKLATIKKNLKENKAIAFPKTFNDQEKRVDADDEGVTEAVELLPTTQRERGRQLLQRLQKRKDLISWNDKGEVTIEGKILPGSNIADLVSDVMRTRKQVAPLRGTFLDVLAKANVPDEFVRNKTALIQFRKRCVSSSAGTTRITRARP